MKKQTTLEHEGVQYKLAPLTAKQVIADAKAPVGMPPSCKRCALCNPDKTDCRLATMPDAFSKCIDAEAIWKVVK